MAILGNTTLITGECYKDFTIDEDLSVAGTSTLTGAVSVGSTLTVTGATTLNSTLAVTGKTTHTGTTQFNGGVTVKSGNGTNSSSYVLQTDGNARQVVTTIDTTTGIPTCTAINTELAKYLPLSGGTLTGPLTIGSTSATKNLTVNGTITCTDKVNATNGFYQTSDARRKTNLRDLDLDKCYDLIDKCQTVLYDWKDGDKDQMGMIAQEVEEFFPEIVQTDSKGFKSLDYAKLTVIILRVLKDLIKKINDSN